MSVSLGTRVLEPPGEFCTAAAMAEVGAAAERVGFDGVYVSDHPVPHPSYAAHGGHHALDPFVALAFVAAATTRLRLQTHLVVVPYRNPFLTAKTVASLDVLSGGRVLLGVGAGYMEPEFAALGVDFDERNDLLDEAIVAMKRAWSGEPFDLRGRHFTAEGNEALPRPVQRPQPPIWVGGNSRRAIRRAVEQGDGWIPFPNPPDGAASRHSRPLRSLDDLGEGIAYARRHALAVGREAPLDIAFMPGAFAYWDRRALTSDEIVDNCAAMADLGVTYLMATVGAPTRAAYLEQLERYGAEILPAVAEL